MARDPFSFEDRGMPDETPNQEREVETTSTPAQGAARTRRPLVRSLHDRKVAGVAGGIAEHLNIDPLLVRIAFVVSAFAGGIGVLLYLAGWILIPEEGDQDPHRSAIDRARSVPWLAVGLFVVGGTLLLSQVSAWDEGPIFWGLVLIGVGWLLFRDDPSPRPEPAPAVAGAPEPGALAAPVSARVEPRRRPRSALGRYTFAAMLIVVGTVALLDYAGALTLRAGQYPALALIVVAGGLLVGTLWGRSRALIVLGLLIAPFAWAGALVDVPLEGGFAGRSYSPTVVEELRDEYRLAGGVLQIDLTELEWGRGPVEIDASVAFGAIEVLVPEGVEVDFRGSVGAGEIEFFDQIRDGVEVELAATAGEMGAERTLVLDARSSFGKIEVADSLADLNS
jgi:phage shock protein PspC (stress-responsive transcriptional regulator)